MNDQTDPEDDPNATGISWTDRTWNPWQGCAKVSAACRHCYMFRDKTRFGQDPSVVVRSAAPTFNLPAATGKRAIRKGSLVFTCSWSDWFHADADPWRDEAWALIRRRRDCLFLILTKRAERIADHLPADWGPDGYPNVALGVTAENQECADHRIPFLLKVPARFRFVSIEPMVGPIDDPWFLGFNHVCTECGAIGEPDSQAFEFCAEETIKERRLIDWVIVGGESGPTTRPLATSWVRSLRDACAGSCTLFHFKQWGETIPRTQLGDLVPSAGARVVVSAEGEEHLRLGVDVTGHKLDGLEHQDRLPWRDTDAWRAQFDPQVGDYKVWPGGEDTPLRILARRGPFVDVNDTLGVPLDVWAHGEVFGSFATYHRPTSDPDYRDTSWYSHYQQNPTPRDGDS